MMGVTRFRSLKRKPLPMPSIVTKVYGSGLASPPCEFDEVTFSLKRSKRGAVIYLHQSSQTWNLNYAIDKWPATFDEARKLVATVAATHGWPDFKEVTKKRDPLPRGADRRNLADGKCSEAWLRSDIPKLFAEAALRCQHAGGYCIQDGFCHYGDCDMEMEQNPRPAIKQDGAYIYGCYGG